jgi:ubiquinone/menaquinone biosynthesis C-methylase UbiE
MGFYSRHLFPGLCDLALGGKTIARERADLLSLAKGEVLEIGIGTGRNVPFYSADEVTKLYAVDVNPGMSGKAERRIAKSRLPVEHRVVTAEALPFPDASIDTVVSTWTMCSIPAVEQALAEAFRVLRPGGQLLFMEHGLSPAPSVRRWQHRLQPLWRRLADGCHLDRDIPSLIRASPFTMDRLDVFDMPDMPRFVGHTFKGRATKR